MTVADMNRLEQAARVSMGEFQDPDTSAEPLPLPHRRLLWGIGLALCGIALLLVVLQLT
ncbi:hypothetical protein [Mesorhizobium comanense]|uniref:hypothetical protein n=1 Tax=Mesorhizobium comanense TaxID=2502215 RepID=UPI0014859FBC|nr:hypothetical protein [Mesorhizobium comanense]